MGDATDRLVGSAFRTGHGCTCTAGKRDAIALAVELHADLLLMDDRAGVTAARSLGLVVTGALGLLAIAHEHGLVDLETAFALLKETNFRYRQGLLVALLARHGKRQG